MTSMPPPDADAVTPKAHVVGRGRGPRRTPVIALLAVPALIAATAFATTSVLTTTKVDAAEITSAANRTIEQGSARMVVTSRAGIPGTDEEFEFELDGVSDLESQRMTATMRLSEMPELEGLGLGADELSAQMRGEGFVLYVRNALLDNVLPSGRSWLRVDLARIGRVMGMDLEALAGASSGSDQFDLLNGASGEFVKHGSERVHGVETTRYSGIVDMRIVADGLDERQAEAVRQTVRQLERLGAEPLVPVEVWIDEAGLARRVKQVTRQQPEGAPEPIETEMDMQIVEFTSDSTEIEMPPAAQTIDLFDLLPPGALRQMALQAAGV